MTEFDPTQHTVAQTQDYLDVLAAERDGKARKGILEHQPPAESEENKAVTVDDGYTRQVISS